MGYRTFVAAAMLTFLCVNTMAPQTIANYVRDDQGRQIRVLLVPQNQSFLRLQALVGRSLSVAVPIGTSGDVDLALQSSIDNLTRDIRTALFQTQVATSSGQSQLQTVALPQAQMFVGAVLTAGATIAALKALQGIIDNALEKADAIATSQLLAARKHIAATIADLDAAFKHNLNTAFDKLNDLQQKILTQANVLLFQMQESLRALETDAFDRASELVCQATVALASFQIISLKQKPPDVFCLTEPRVRDAGPYHDQLLSFRGARLRPGGEYPRVKLIVPALNQTIDLLTGGGDSVLQVALPGGINGKPGDLTPRGNLIVRADFDWNSERSRRQIPVQRWLFVVRPYMVSSVTSIITPKIRQPSYRLRAEPFYVYTDRGGETNAAWVMTKQQDASRIVSCSWRETNKVGDSGLTSGVQSTPGACTTTAIARGAKGGIFGGGGGGSYGIEMTITEEVLSEVAGPEHHAQLVINQAASNAVVKYNESLVPSGAQVIDYDYSWRVDITKNTGEQFVLTNTQKSQPGLGSASMSTSGELTVTLIP